MTDEQLPGISNAGLDLDPARDEIANAFLRADPTGERMADVFRETFDLLYDGQHTGRYRWDQLMKTEKTHYGSMFEIILRRAFNDVIDDVPDDDSPLDYRVLGHDIDCKYSQNMNQWMLPPECFGHLLLVATSNDHRGIWSLGIVRASDENRREKGNRDKKTQLNPRGTSQIQWLFRDAQLPPNILLSLDTATIDRIFASRSGAARIRELCRLVTGRIIGRNTVATVAQQDDYMARIRDNGGARTTLRPEGYLIPGGDYEVHRAVARQLGQPVPRDGEIVSFQVVPAGPSDTMTVELDGRLWRAARAGEAITEPAPKLPATTN
ncbi:NaeI family type II restriction endonuclease [Nocardioides sp. SYSU D00038]|uniref:NaeI family type II restriction endonuclease n=1 Tax=Nocardioides sp. SYSU D00038 TaxID=2812554 RepID=UPI001967BE69|nr:NaeI family type II restriction endonuclease [Nocardioides sp. SYSU D00038]